MKNHQLNLLAFSLVIAVVSVGCTQGSSLAWRRNVASNVISDVISDAEPASIDRIATSQPVMERPAIEESPAVVAPTTFVRVASEPESLRPTLVTLPSDGDLTELVRTATGPVLLDFYADWCGPCRVQGKILHDLEETAAEHNTTIIKINVDEHQQIAQQLQVSSLPTLVMIRDGEIVQRQSGIMRKPRLEDWMR